MAFAACKLLRLRFALGLPRSKQNCRAFAQLAEGAEGLILRTLVTKRKRSSPSPQISRVDPRFSKKLRFPLAREARFPYCISLRRGLSAVGSAPPCQGGGRGFEPRSPLHTSTKAGLDRPFSYRRSGQVVRQGPAKPSPPVRIRASPPRAHRAPAFAGALFA